MLRDLYGYYKRNAVKMNDREKERVCKDLEAIIGLLKEMRNVGKHNAA